MLPLRSALGVLAATTLTLAACGSDDGPAEQAGDVPTVVATTSIWADITANVACDGLATVQSVIPPGGDPHSFEPSIRDRETMEAARLVVANGLDLEESLVDTLDAVEAAGTTVLHVAEGLDTIPGTGHADEPADDEEHADDEAHVEDEEHAGDDEHGGDDPHVWWDPTRIAASVPLIAEALAGVGIDEAALTACSEAYLDELATLDADVDQIVSALPPDERLLVTNHDSLGYFADRYGFEVVGSVIPSSSSLAGTSPAELDRLADAIAETGVPAIFADTQSSSDDADALADRLGDVEVVDILTDTLDEPGSEADNYIDWLRSNAATIVDALAG